MTAVPSLTGKRATIAAELANTLRYSRLSLVQTWLKPSFPNVCHARLGKPDQFRERVAVENVKGIVDADFAGKLFCWDGHTGAAITAG